MAVLQEKITLHQNYLHTFHNLFYFLLDIFFLRKPFDFIILSLLAWNGSKRKMRNLPHEVTTATWINLYTCFISSMFSCCEHVSWTSRESSVAGFTNKANMTNHILHAVWCFFFLCFCPLFMVVHAKCIAGIRLIFCFITEVFLAVRSCTYTSIVWLVHTGNIIHIHAARTLQILKYCVQLKQTKKVCTQETKKCEF